MNNAGKTNLKGVSVILFDAGDTLVKPRSGHWYISPRMYEILSKHGYTVHDRSFLIRALEGGFGFLNGNHSIQTEEEEVEQFAEYYRLVLNSMGIPTSESSIHIELAEDMTFNDDKFVFFEDSAKSLAELKSMEYRLGILSNTWPSLIRVFKNAGYSDYFEFFFVSSRIGTYKPSRSIFDYTIQQIGLNPTKILFVDDSDDNLRTAVAVGMRPLKISRYAPCGVTSYPCITNMAEIFVL